MINTITTEQQSILSVVIRDRTGILFQGNTESISSYNEKGIFDVLPLHTNFITLIEKEIVLRVPPGIEKRLSVEAGVLKVKENKVEVYLGIIRRERI